MSIYAIGDVQGCFRSLQGLVTQLPLQDGDRIWLCGDLVNRGPQSAEVLRWAMAQGERVVCVLGNHDLHLLAAAAGARAAKPRDTLQEVLAADDCDALVSWLRTRPLLHREQGHVLVHAGLHPAWSLEQACQLADECAQAVREERWLAAWAMSRTQAPTWSAELAGDERLSSALSTFVSVRTLDASLALVDYAGPLAERPPGTQPWFALREYEETLVFGHWAALGLHVDDRHIGLDTGCVWGGALTAIRLEDRKIFTQPALEKL